MSSLLKSVLASRGITDAIFEEKTPLVIDTGNMLDSTKADAEVTEANFVITDEMREDAVAVVQEWAESELEKDEGFGDRLYALCVGTANADGETDLTDDEGDYAAAVAELVGDYLEGKGIDAADVDALLGDLDFDNTVASRVHDALLDNMPEGDEAMMDDAGKFVLGEDDKMLDATYKKVMAVRGGKKVRIKKRVAGKVRLSAGQKAAVKKMQRKSFSGAAKMKRAKSMRMRRRILGK